MPGPPVVLVTGAHGFVGRHLVKALAQDFPEAKVHIAGFDMTASDEIYAAIRSIVPDVCIHLAAVSTVSTARRQPDQAWRVNLWGTLALARAVLNFAPHCRLLFASSADAYGLSFTAGHALDEAAALAPLNTYAATKAAADLALGALVGDGLQVIRLRLFNHTGPGQSADFVVAAFAYQLARIEAKLQPPDLVVGALDTQRDFLDVRDVCAAYLACVRFIDALPNGAIINIASGVPRRIGDILEELIAFTGLRVTVTVDAARLRPNEILTAAGNATRARRMVDWEPRITWERTLTDVLADWRRRVQPLAS